MGGQDANDIAAPYVKALADFRTAVRKAAKEGNTTALLQASDAVRDEVMPKLGVKLSDDDAAFPYYFVDKATLLEFVAVFFFFIFFSAFVLALVVLILN